jgi:hypothetical protein
MAGFPSGENGAWTFCEIDEGDFVSFLYGARAYNLYRVSEKIAIADAERVPPWKPLTFKESGKTYSFPYRLQLESARKLVEPIARSEFFYVAENLLLRGGYRRTHFQTDQTTLQSVSQMGNAQEHGAAPLDLPPYRTFTLQFTRDRAAVAMPQVCHFRETILQSAVRHHLSVDSNLEKFLSEIDFDARASDLEVLGEKALAQGHVDLLLKQRVPLGASVKIPVEVKSKRGMPPDLEQLEGYVAELGDECPFGVLLADDFARQTIERAARTRVKLIRYRIGADLRQSCTFDAIWGSLSLHLV